MLSILIPVYNWRVAALVADLSTQAEALGLACEILCFDDASTDAAARLDNRTQLAAMPRVDYRELPENLGRARIRNRLAAEARHPYLLFMDCDSGVTHPDYLQRYVKCLPSDAVLYGGRVYADEPPTDPALHFHWRYGRQREQRTAAQRAVQPHHAFMTNNFLMPKATFEGIGFEGRLRQYGHEDTLFGMALRQRGIPVLHLDNPLAHLGLERDVVFLEKSRQALDNLRWLHQEGHAIETRLTRWAGYIQRAGLSAPMRALSRTLLPLLEAQVTRRGVPLAVFDLYKLLHLIRSEE